MTRKIAIYPYDSHWPLLFAAESKKIKNALGDNCIAIHHIGSTSIPGLAAKPVIDMIPEVRDICVVDQHNAAMQSLGYIPQGENGIPFRRFFQKTDDTTCNVHVFASGNPEITRHILFRDYLRTHHKERDVYADLKQQLAQQFPHDIDSYISGKQGFIEDIVQQAGFNDYRLIIPRSIRELAYFHRINRQLDPTFTLTNHYHFLFIKGSNAIGTAHIELLEANQCVIRNITIDPMEQYQSEGLKLLKLLEKWIFEKNYSLLETFEI
ncbi:MAG TPA: GrpB family protein [Gammaproteobacteria bacterium]|nr:GrpB family protein [Gammaproteobacteria bacterium]